MSKFNFSGILICMSSVLPQVTLALDLRIKNLTNTPLNECSLAFTAQNNQIFPSPYPFPLSEVLPYSAFSVPGGFFPTPESFKALEFSCLDDNFHVHSIVILGVDQFFDVYNFSAAADQGGGRISMPPHDQGMATIEIHGNADNCLDGSKFRLNYTFQIFGSGIPEDSLTQVLF